MDESKTNLKGNKDQLAYYRIVNTGTLEPRLKLVAEENQEHLVSRTYYYPEQDKVKFTEEEVRKFSLDSYGENIPYIDGELTIFNNYLFDFWGYYLNAEGLALYGHLKRHAYGNKDWCYPNLDLISMKMDKSRPTILTYLDILERYGFAYQFGVLNFSKEGMEESPVFKLRKKVPLLTNSLIYGNPELEIPEDAPPHIKKALKKEKKGLPERLRKEHEKYVSLMIESNEPVKLEKDIDFESIYHQWLQFGEIMKTSKDKGKTVAQVKTEKNMDKLEKNLLEFIKTYVSRKISKPSFDTWFKDVLLRKDENQITILAPNEFAKDWLEERYSELIKIAVEEYGIDVESIYIEMLK